MASVAGVYGNAGQANYAASKAGVIGLTKTVARELGSRGVTCNAIAPGIIQTAMTDVLPQELKDKYLTAISLRRFGTVEDVAKAALFLAEAEYVTAQTLLVDGGLQM
jgi:3-oxoacyl-[acyl-carrier protein] reductase